MEKIALHLPPTTLFYTQQQAVATDHNNLMFIAIVCTIAALVLAAEMYILRRTFPPHQPRRTAYIAASALCFGLYPLLMLVGRLWEMHSEIWSATTSVAMIVWLLNATVKVCSGVGLWLERATGIKLLRQLCTLVAAIVAAAILYGTLIERHQLRVEEVSLYYPNLPRSADGVRIAQIADLHIGTKPTRQKVIERTVEAINRANVEIVIDCGDVINTRYTELDSQMMALLGSIEAPRGIYTVEGNHDTGIYIRDTVELPRDLNLLRYHQKLDSIGWQDVTNRTVALHFGRNDTILLTGLPYPDLKRGRHKGTIEEDYSAHFDSLPANAFNIVAAHTPAVWESITKATHAELTLSGHTHSMQLKLPLGDSRGWSPAAMVYKHWSGLYEQGGKWLSVSDGIGSSVPLRIGTKPEIIIFTLRKQ